MVAVILMTALCLCACVPVHKANHRKLYGLGIGILQTGRINIKAHSMLLIQICTVLFFCNHVLTAHGAKNKIVPLSGEDILRTGALPSGRQGSGLIYFDRHTIVFRGKAGGGLFPPPQNIT